MHQQKYQPGFDCPVCGIGGFAETEGKRDAGRRSTDDPQAWIARPHRNEQQACG